MARTHTKLVSTNLTPDQRDVLKQLAGTEGQAAYLRRLIAQDAARRGIAWPEHPGQGQHARK